MDYENTNLLPDDEYSISYFTDPLDEAFDLYDTDPVLSSLSESQYDERAKKEVLSLELLDIDKYIKVNNLQEVTNPSFFGMGGMPTSDGLLSNEIFGMTMKDRQGTFAYISLNEWFIDPSCYKTLLRLDKNFGFIVKGLKKFKINENGELIEDEDGGTGIRWLKANFGKIKFKHTDSRGRETRIKYIEHNYEIGRMFVNKWIVIPPFYRDVNTSGKNVGVGQINTLYVNLISAAKAIKDNDDYGLSMADTTCARVQDTLKTIYDWFCGNRNDTITDKGTGLGGKFGMIRANMNYTSDYSSRLVLSAPELKADTVDDLMVTFDKSAIPLAAVAADFYPFMLFHMRKFFENEFLNTTSYEVLDEKGKRVIVSVGNVMMYFSDEVLKDRIKKYVYSHDNRFTLVQLPTESIVDETGNPVKMDDPNKRFYMQFKGQRWISPEEGLATNPEPAIHRPLTWVDVIYIAAKKSTEGKQMSFTRYPYDSYFNTIYTGIEVSSTKETEPLYVNGEYYKFYPKIRIEDIGNSSAAKFVDTMQISNLYLRGIAGDYDGDTGMVKGSFFKETNEELQKFQESKANFIGMACENIRVSEKEAVQAVYNFTKILSQDMDKLTAPIF